MVGVVAGLVDSKAVGPAVEHRRQERVELRREQDRLDAGPCARLVLAEEPADVVLDLRVGRRDEQELAAARTAGQQNEDGLGLLDTGQIEEIAVLPVFVVDVPRIHAGRRTPQDRHRAIAQRRHQARPAGLQILAERGHLGIGLCRYRDGVMPACRERYDKNGLQQARCACHAPKSSKRGSSLRTARQRLTVLLELDLHVQRLAIAKREPAADDAVDEPDADQANRQPGDDDADAQREDHERDAERDPQQSEPERPDLPCAIEPIGSFLSAVVAARVGSETVDVPFFLMATTSLSST